MRPPGRSSTEARAASPWSGARLDKDETPDVSSQPAEPPRHASSGVLGPADSHRSSQGRNLMRRMTLTSLAVALVLMVLVSALAWAQQAAAPPTWKQGQPASMADSTLAPIPQPPAPKAAADIPVDKIKVPPGFKAELWASGINNARAMTWGDKGTLFVSSRVAGNVYAVVDKGGTREVKTTASGLNLPNGVAFKNGTLYIAEVSKISKLEGIEDKLDSPPPMVTVIDTLPKDLPHGWKYLAFGPDGKLYFNIGAPCNICIPPD